MDASSAQAVAESARNDPLISGATPQRGRGKEPHPARARATDYLVWTTQPEGDPADVASWCAFTGQSLDAVTQGGWLSAIHSDERMRASLIWSDAVATRGPFDRECRVRRADGRYRRLLVRGVPMRHADNSVREWVLTGTDVTTHKEHDHDTAQARARELEAILEAVADGVVVFDHEGRIVHENPAARELASLDARTEGPTRTVHEVGLLLNPRDEDGQPLPEGQWPGVRALRGETLRGSGAPDVLLRTLDGHDILVNMSAAPVHDTAGQVLGGVLILRDVTERRQLDRQAQAAERERLRLRTLLDVLPAAVGMMDAQARVLENNPANTALWGEGVPGPGEMPQFQMWHGWWPDTGKPLALEEWAVMRALISGETIINQEVEVETSGGQRKVILASAAPIRDEHGAIIGVTGIHQDITERKRLEEALRQAERDSEARASQLAAILEAMADGVVVFDHEGSILHENPAAWKLLTLDRPGEGFPRTIRGMGRLFNVRDEHGEPLPEEQWPPLRALRGETLRGAGAVDILIRAPDGRDVLVNMSAAPVHDTAGQMAGGVLVSRDVTERHRLEHQTHAALDALVAMAEALVQAPEPPEAAPADQPAAPEAETGGAHRPANQTAQRLVELAQRVLGGERLSLIALDQETGALRPLAAFRPNRDEARWWASVLRSRVDDYLAPALLARLQAGEVVLADLTQPTAAAAPDWPTSSTRAVLVAPMLLQDRLVGFLVLRYRTAEHPVTAEERALTGAVAQLAALVLERERLQGEREAARATALALTEATQRMDEFLGVATHELKNPVTSSVLSVALAARRLESLLAQEPLGQSALTGQLEGLRRLLAGAEASTERLHRLVVDLLDVSRLHAGQLEFRLAPADLAAIVRDAVAEQRQLAPTRVIQLRLPATVPVPVVADTDRIGQVVTNYLSNALKYAPEDQSVGVRVAVRAGQARLAVRDRGPGLPAEEQRRIWERDHQAPGVAAHAGAGRGLGVVV